MGKKQMYVNETKLSELFDIPVQILRGIMLTRARDTRVLRIGEVVGVNPDECYELQEEETQS